MSFLRVSSASSTPRSSTSSDEGLRQITLSSNYDVIQELARGSFGLSVLARCRHTDSQVTLKLISKETMALKDFMNVFRYSVFLSAHPAIANSYDVGFETGDCYAFAQEFAPSGDLQTYILQNRVRLPENSVKSIVRQLASALFFMHSKSLVHQDIQAKHVLLYDQTNLTVKLTDFGQTREAGVKTRKTLCTTAYTAPEIAQTARNEQFTVAASGDIWCLGVLIYFLLTCNFAWNIATPSNFDYVDFRAFQRRKTLKPPSKFRLFTERLLRLFRRLFEEKVSRRCPVDEIFKYLKDDWYLEKKPYGKDEQQPSSSSKEKSVEQLEKLLHGCRVDTLVNRKTKNRMIENWLTRSCDTDFMSACDDAFYPMNI